MKILTVWAIGLIVSSAALANINGAWKGFSEPDIIGSGFTHKFTDLPLNGSMKIGPKAWSGHFWPSKKGGINNRWNSPNDETFNYKSPSLEAVKNMSIEQLSTLAPTEKYDLFTGRYDYPLKSEAMGSASRFANDWAGICHGWAPASVHHNEPTAKVLTNPDGIRIPFGSADIKALLSYYYAFYDDTFGGQVGLRCYFGSWLGGARACGEDLNAGAMHIVIGNKIGIQKAGLMMDRDRWREVWNQPLISYKSTILAANLAPERSAAEGTVREVRVATELFYVNESDPNWNIVHGTAEQKIEKLDLQYRLELNAEGKIIGGVWESKDRPDFLWYKEKTAGFTGLLSDLPALLND